jgi:hypothetical protein
LQRLEHCRHRGLSFLAFAQRAAPDQQDAAPLGVYAVRPRQRRHRKVNRQQHRPAPTEAGQHMALGLRGRHRDFAPT